MTFFQLLILIFVAFVIFKAVCRLAKKEISVWLFGVWLFFWLLIALIAIFPVIINRLADLTGVGRGVDFVIYLALFVLFYLFFKINVRLNKIDKNISEIVRKTALDKAVKKNYE